MLEVPENFDNDANVDAKFYMILFHSIEELDKRLKVETEDWDEGDQNDETARRIKIFVSEAKKLASEMCVGKPFNVDFGDSAPEYWIDILRSACLRWALTLGGTRDPRLTEQFVVAPDFRTEIRELTRKIRKVILNADIDAALAERLDRRLTAFEIEIDRRKTNLQSAISVWLDITQAIGDGVTNLEPAVRMAERIVEAFNRKATAQIASEIKAALPKPENAQPGQD